jgi:protein disulfide-isomerase A6
MDDQDSDYFVYFTAPGCGFCKAVEPVVEELATYYKHDRRMKIGKIDMIKNEIAHPNVHIRAYPSFYLFLGDEKLNPVAFDGERSAHMITQFIADERAKYRSKQRKPTI